MLPSVKCLYFEDFQPGDSFNVPARTITEADIVFFAGLSGDQNPIHTDEEFAKTTFHGTRIAHGLLILSVVSGLTTRLGFTEKSILAFIGIKWKFISPVKIGDTISARIKISNKKEVDEKSGLVIYELEVFNQRQEVVQKGEWTILVAKTPPTKGV